MSRFFTYRINLFHHLFYIILHNSILNIYPNYNLVLFLHKRFENKLLFYSLMKKCVSVNTQENIFKYNLPRYYVSASYLFCLNL